MAVMALSLTLVLGVASSSSAATVTVTDMAHGTTASDMAQALAGSGINISNVTFTGSQRGAGSFTGGATNVGFASGVVLNSGYVQTDTDEDGTCSEGVEGPNDCSEDPASNGDNSSSLGTAGDADLDTLLTGGLLTEDATVLEFDFVPQESTVSFNYVFSSEEYNNFANSSYNDVFGFFINDTNCALVPGTTDPVTINTINNGNPDGDTTPHHADLYRDNVRPSPSIDIQMDGLTTVLTCTANVTAGATSHMKLAIADASDSALDSAVFIAAGSFVSGQVLTVSKNGTGTGTVTSNPAGINCGSTCSAGFSNGTMVTLTADRGRRLAVRRLGRAPARAPAPAR